ncbi:alpha/beta hydrolase-fold protein [Sphingomonas bacterium]|uniref:alpha/beta hydrolase n=1 Tax=Sphingomonas bacterium TaxID=1895847 RepID=UPI0026148F1A|nr:alpha/beta hydrolase-fold protein [Sphingomonas bacterium]MDB5677765.1 enterochelin esterase [Sphingomonas bacterium]
MIRTLALLGSALLLGAAGPSPKSVAIPVSIAASLGDHQSGRLIVFVERVDPRAKPSGAVDFNAFAPTGATIAAREVADLRPARTATIDAETDAFPAPLSKLAPSRYRIQAVLDRNHDYAYDGRGPGDLVSPVITVTLPGPIPTVTLSTVVPATDAAPRPELAKYYPLVRPVAFQSNAMTAFRGTPTFIRGWVALPPGYDGKARFPTVYSDGGFGSSVGSAKRSAASMMAMMADGKAPPMIWVYLDHNGGTGTHEFADSANNGPWGTALTSELIPALEREYRMDARPSGRFLTGHSSGGWSTLWLQVRYPKIFGGSWPTSPDPSDFHDFTNVDLYAPGANFYADAGGKPYPLIREKGKVIASLADFARSEAVMGPYGGQIASFEWVFSPRGIDGRPVPLFDRATGRIDPAVVAYWRDNYDIANIIRRDWPALKPDLDGKIHLTVGTADTFYLDGPAHRLEAVMTALGAKTDFRYLPGKTHFDLYQRGDDKNALLEDIAWEMYAVARPGSTRPN